MGLTAAQRARGCYTRIGGGHRRVICPARTEMPLNLTGVTSTVASLLSPSPAVGPVALVDSGPPLGTGGSNIGASVGSLLGRAVTGGSPIGDAIGTILGGIGG